MQGVDVVTYVAYGVFALLILYVIALWDSRIAVSIGLIVVVAAIITWGAQWQKL